VSLNIYNIYESLILESVSHSQIIDSINQPYRVQIYYQGEKETQPNWRSIDPYVLGVSTAGNEIIRAYHSHGYSQSGKKSTWKTYRVDRILQWKPTGQHIGNKPIDAYDSMIPKYRLDGGDDKMVRVIDFRKFGDVKLDNVVQKQVDDLNNQIGNKPVQPKIEPKVTSEPKIEPKITPEPKIKPQVINKPLPTEKQPNITANPEDGEAEIEKNV
jgi:hypothetical protein